MERTSSRTIRSIPNILTSFPKSYSYVCAPGTYMLYGALNMH